MTHIDLDTFTRLTAGDAALQQMLLAKLLEAAPALVKGAETAALGGDAAGLKRSAHTLKGSCLAIGARELARICGQLEYCASIPGEIAQAESLAPALRGEWESVQDDARCRLAELGRQPG